MGRMPQTDASMGRPMIPGQTALLILSYLAVAGTACTEMVDLEARMGEWVDLVPYSHLVNKTYSYPTDCSGFVSWALQAGRDIKSYEYASDNISSRIDTDSLRYGDIITHVFDKTPLGRCASKEEEEEEEEEENATEDYTASPLVGDLGHVSGHVFFFDRWEDEDHENFWAYESSETQDQTEACLAQRGLLTRSQCFNHHVLKSRSLPEKWSKENCTDPEYGFVSGGPRRLSADLLCASSKAEPGVTIQKLNRFYVDPVTGQNESFRVFVPPEPSSSSSVNNVTPALVSFAHGAFLLPELYDWFGEAAAATGRVVAMARVPGVPDSRRLAVAAAAGFLGAREEARTVSDSPLAGLVGDVWVAAGHSLGGGTSFLSADPQVINDGNNASTPLPAGLLTLSAGAWTLPPAAASAARVAAGTPALLLTGSEDCIDPPENNSLKLYDALGSSSSSSSSDGKECKGVVSIVGGCHCNFASFSAGCSLSQRRCGASDCLRGREAQQAATVALLSPWLDLVEEAAGGGGIAGGRSGGEHSGGSSRSSDADAAFAAVLDALVADGTVSILAQDWGGCPMPARRPYGIV